MRVNKLFNLLLILVLFSSIVNAEVYVNYNLKEGKIDQQGKLITTDQFINNINVIGFVCLDENCQNLGNTIFKSTSKSDPSNPILNSGEDYFIQLKYPTDLQSQYGYGVYFFKDGHIPWEMNPNWHGNNEPNNAQGPYDIYLTKKEVCSSKIKEFNIQNSEKPGHPVIVSVEADFSAETNAGINEDGPLKAVPDQLKSQYSVKDLVSLNIFDNNENLVFSEEKELIIEFGKTGNAEFSYTPLIGGNYKALVTSKAVDEKCLSYIPDNLEKSFVVFEEISKNMCYTKLSDLELNKQEFESGDNLVVNFEKLSNLQINNNVEAISTNLRLELVNERNEVVFNENFVVGSNDNTVNLQKFELGLIIPEYIETGYYNLDLTGIGEDNRCLDDNKEEILSTVIFVEQTPGFNQGPEIISEPITKALLGENYLYDVDAIDNENDKITYFLLFAPQGMSINSDTGLISWFVSSENFREGDKKHVIVGVNDGGFLPDVQLFTITIDDKIKEITKKHDFKFSGLNLETSNIEDGINGLIQLKNNGDFKENGISITAEIYELNTYEVLSENVNLGKRDSFWIPINMKLPRDTKEGEYLLNVKLSNNKHAEEQTFVVFISSDYNTVTL